MLSASPEPITQDDPSPEPVRGKPIVVCVDDEPEVLRALERVLRDDSYEVRTTDDPVEALEWVKTGGVDVLLVDQRMPVMKGTELLQNAQDLSPRTARILLTAYPGDALDIGAMRKIDLALIGKPWDDEALRKLVRERIKRDQGI